MVRTSINWTGLATSFFKDGSAYIYIWPRWCGVSAIEVYPWKQPALCHASWSQGAFSFCTNFTRRPDTPHCPGCYCQAKETLAIVAEHEDLLRIAEAAVTSRRVRRILWITALPFLFTGCWLIYPPGIISVLLVASGSFLLIIAQRYFARRERESYIWITAIMLAMEILASDFADLGKRFPSAAMSAKLTLRLYNRNPALFLDAYMLKRDVQAATRALS